ncbi:methyltransferase [Actinomycetaceae bacterium TAE3-ERU4]|nr:methyltransferase [Actinomycetaceae bacterium TAE3-ERU4]
MSEHYFSNVEPATELNLQVRQVQIRGREYRIYTADRVFSHTRLDLATSVLLDYAPKPIGDCLDIGCGWGPITLGLAAESKGKVTAVDVNDRAIQLTRLNAQNAGFSNVVVSQADQALEELTPAGPCFDTIWSNPPVRVGKEQMRQILSSWLRLLRPSGRAYLVIGNNLGAKPTINWLNESGYRAEKLKSKKGFSLIEVAKQ